MVPLKGNVTITQEFLLSKQHPLMEFHVLMCWAHFINRAGLPLFCEKSGAILLVLVGLMAGWQAVQQAVRRYAVDLKIFTDRIIRISQSLIKVQSSTNRVIAQWNYLPSYVVTADSKNGFKLILTEMQ